MLEICISKICVIGHKQIKAAVSDHFIHVSCSLCAAELVSAQAPLCRQDYGGGGAYPECHVAQYPLGMGQEKAAGSGSNNTLAVQLDAQGKVKYDAIARQGHSKDKVSSPKWLTPRMR